MQPFFYPLCTLWLQARTHATMQTSSRSVASIRAEGEDVPSPLSGSALELVNAICQVMIFELRGEELKLVCEDMNELRANTTKAPDHISIWFDSIENTVPSAVVSDEVAHLRTDANEFSIRILAQC